MFQNFDKFPSADYDILEPVSQNDSHINYRAYNKIEGVFCILKYVFLKKSSAETNSFFCYLESISNLNRNLFLSNYHIFQDESLEGPNSDSDDLTLVLCMQHNVGSMKQILDTRRSKNQVYNEAELAYILWELVLGIMKIQPGIDSDLNAEYHNQSIMASRFLCFNLDAFMVVPTDKAIDLDNEDQKLKSNYTYRISNFDSIGQPNMDLSEEDVIRCLSNLILQMMGLEIDSYHLLENYPQLGPLLHLMKKGEITIYNILSSLEGMNRFPANEDLFWPLDPEIPELAEIERVKTFETYTESYYQLGFYNFALRPALLNLQYFKNKNPESPECAKAMNDVGVLYWRSGKVEQALEILIDCMELMKKLYDQDHVVLSVCYNNLAVVFEDISEFNEALKYYKMAYELRINAESYDTVPIAMNNLACLYSRMNQEMGEAKVLFENSLEMKESINKPISLSTSMNNFAVFNANSGDFDKAIELLEKAKSLIEQYRNETNLIILNNLAFIYVRKGRINDAMDLYMNATMIINDQYRVLSGVTVQILSNYGYLFYQMNQFQRAVLVLEKALEMKAKLNGTDSLNYAIIANNLGESYLKMDRFLEAVEVLEKSIDIRCQKCDPKDRKCLLSWNNLGMTYLKLKDFENAFRCLNNAVDIDPNDCASLNNLGLLYSMNEQFINAIEYYEKAYQSICSSKGMNSEETLKITSNMAALYVKLKEFDKAEEFLKTSLTIAQESFPEKIDFIVKTKERIEHLIRVREANEKAFL